MNKIHKIMKIIKYLGVIFMALGYAACNNDDKPYMDQNFAVNFKDEMVKGIQVTLSDYDSDNADTRTSYSTAEGGIKVTWAQDDTIGIFPNVGGQVEFPINVVSESNQAKFDGGGWALRADNTYSAYYPFDKANVYRDNKTILLDYTGQMQVDNGSTTHLAKYDYQATGGVMTSDDGYLNFQFKHLGALMLFRLIVPQTGVYTSLTLKSSENVFVNNSLLDISGNEPVLKPLETSNIFTLQLGNIELTADNSELTVFLILTPIDLSQVTLELCLNGSNYYSTSLTGHNLEAGKQYNINTSFETPSENEIIEFADDKAKAICIDHFDKNGDGELSMAEAAAVTSMPMDLLCSSVLFKMDDQDETKKLTSFKELQYFTSLKEIPYGMFMYQYDLEEVTLPKSITRIGSYAFYNCSSLKSIVIPDNVTTFEDRVFSGCTNLTNVVVGNCVKSIGYYAFENCSSLSDITLGNSITIIGERAFRNCSSLTSINLPNNVTTIEMCSFEDCSHLANIYLPNSLTTISYQAFYNCSSLSDIDIPGSVTTIGAYVFENCSSLTSINIPNSVTSYAGMTFSGCSNLSSVTIGDGVTEIGGTFYGCTSLKNITFGKNVNLITENTLKDCINLESITIKSIEPPVTGSSSPYSSHYLVSTCTIYVPASSVERYKTNRYWAKYADQIQAIPE